MTDVLTWFGGGTDDYVQDHGAPIAGAFLDVWDDPTPGSGAVLNDLRQFDTSGVLQTVTRVTCDSRGYYRFAVNNNNGPVYIDPGIPGQSFRFQVNPANLTTRLEALEAAIGAAPSAPVDHGVWASGVSMLRGDYFTSPTTGERRTVAVAYTTPVTYNLAGLDLASTIPTSSGSSASALTPTSIKTAAYTAAAGDLVLVDATAGDVPIALPVGPANRVQVGVKLVATAAGHVATANVAGSVRFNLSTGATVALTIALLNQGAVFQYDTTNSVWIVLSDSVPLSQLDARYSPAAWSQSAADLRYAPLGAFLKEVAVWTGDLFVRGADEDPNGIDMIAAGAIHQLDAVTDLPPEGADAIVNVYKLTLPGNVESLIGTVTVPMGTAHGQFTYTGVGTGGSPDAAFADGDKIFARLAQVGSTFPGAGLKLRIALGGRTFPAVPTPGVPTGFGVTASDATSVTLSWGNGTNSSQGLLYRSNSNGDLVPYWNVGSVTSFVDRGPDGLGLAPGETHTYGIKGRRSSALSALSATAVGGSIAYSAWVKTDGTLDTTVVSPTIGGGGSAGQGITTVTQNGSLAALLKGGNSASSFAAADRVLLIGTNPAGAHSGYAVNTLMSPFNAGSLWEWDLASDTFNLSGTNPANYLQFQGSVNALRIGAKFGSWIPTSVTGQGTTAGSFQNISDPAYPVNLLGTTTRSSSGGLPYGFTLVNTAKYGFRFELQPPTGSGGTVSQVVVIRFGSEAQYGVRGATAASMPVFTTLTVTADRQQYRAPGMAAFQQQGVSAAAGTAGGVYLYDFQVAALTPVGA